MNSSPARQDRLKGHRRGMPDIDGRSEMQPQAAQFFAKLGRSIREYYYIRVLSRSPDNIFVPRAEFAEPI